MKSGTVSHLDPLLPARSALSAMAALHHQPPVVRSTFDSGMRALDDVLDGGVRPGELALIVGKPAAGKTVLALQWASHIARGGGVAIYTSYEHDEATLVTRLLAAELGEMLEEGDPLVAGESASTVSERVRRVGSGRETLSQSVSDDPAIAEACRRVARFADRLVFAASCRLDVDRLADVTSSFSDDPVALFVDYVQKVPAPSEDSGADRSSAVAEQLKGLALDQDIAVVGLAAVDEVGLAARRVHAHHVRGAATFAYEADVIIALNEKLDIVSRAHLANSPTRADEFRRHLVFSVEKNRRGIGAGDVEFTKEFFCWRFERRGRWVAERLWSEGSLEQ